MAVNKEFFVSLGSSAHADNGGGYNPATYVSTYADMFAANDGPVSGPTTDATYTYATGTITKVGAFTLAKVGMYVRVVSGTNSTPGRYAIVSRTDDTVVLGNNIGGTADGITWVVRVGGALTAAYGLASAGLFTSMRVNIKSGTYSSLSALTNYTGAAINPVVYRGYTTTPGDLDVTSRNTDGTLNTTGMPLFNACAIWTPGVFCTYHNLSFTGALSTALISSTSLDNWSIVNCKLVNSQNNSAARTIVCDNSFNAINCDFECSGAAHDDVVVAGTNCNIIGCRFKGVAAVWLLQIDYGIVIDCVFHGNSTINGIQFLIVTTTTFVPVFQNNTFYNLVDAIEIANAASVNFYISINNHITGCTKYLDNPYSATSDAGYIEVNNRYRNVSTPRTGIRQLVTIGEITTAGSDATDFKSVSTGDFTLLRSAPGSLAGMMRYTDIGAYQRYEPPDRPELIVIGS